MQPKKWLLVSLGLNLLLLAGLTIALREIERGSVKPSANPPAVPPLKLTVAVPLKTPAPSTNALTSAGRLQNWVDQLRAAGAPDQLLAELIVADSEGRWKSHDRQLQKKFEKGDLDAEALINAREQHELDQENELRAMLGDAAFRKYDRQKVLADLDLSALNLSESELDGLYQLRKDKDRGQRDLEREQRSGEIDDTDFDQKESQAENDYQQQLKSLLGDRYALLTPPSDSAVTADLKRSLKNMNFNATDDQLSTLTQAQQQWNQQRAALDSSDPDYSNKAQAVDAARDQALSQVLGADGAAQFKKLQDSNYQTLQKYAPAWQLSASDVDYVYQTLQSYQAGVQDYEAQARALEAQGQTVDWAGVQKNIQQFSQQVQGALQTYLTPDRFNKIQRSEFFDAFNPPASQ